MNWDWYSEYASNVIMYVIGLAVGYYLVDGLMRWWSAPFILVSCLVLGVPFALAIKGRK